MKIDHLVATSQFRSRKIWINYNIQCDDSVCSPSLREPFVNGSRSLGIPRKNQVFAIVSERIRIESKRGITLLHTRLQQNNDTTRTRAVWKSRKHPYIHLFVQQNAEEFKKKSQHITNERITFNKSFWTEFSAHQSVKFNSLHWYALCAVMRDTRRWMFHVSLHITSLESLYYHHVRRL